MVPEKQYRYVVLRADPRLRSDTKVCQRVNRADALEIAAKLNTTALAEHPGAHPFTVPLYYVAREQVS